MSWKSRYVSAPSSLSTRGRRGSQYNNMLSELGTIEDEAETQEMDEKYNLIDHKNVEEEEEEKEARRVRRRHSMDEDNPWLLEDDEMVWMWRYPLFSVANTANYLYTPAIPVFWTWCIHVSQISSYTQRDKRCFDVPISDS